VEKYFDQHKANQGWYLLNFALWWNEYVHPRPIPEVLEAAPDPSVLCSPHRGIPRPGISPT
jgi:hypothetical protein